MILQYLVNTMTITALHKLYTAGVIMAQINVIDVNVGGMVYTTTVETLASAKGSLLASYFCNADGSAEGLGKDSCGRWFIDRDGVLFRYILDYLRNRRLVLPENFSELSRLKSEVIREILFTRNYKL